MKYTREQIETAMSSKGYKYFTSNNYDVNIIGVRNSKTKGRVTNAFDDTLTLSYKDEEGNWNYHEFGCTTDPGTHWVENVLLHEDGVAILAPGQYRKSHKIGLHQGKYEALRQKELVTVYRDDNRDSYYDLKESSKAEGIYGINIHRATGKTGGKSTRIDKWSAGCQVIASNDDFKFLMEVANRAARIWGNSFTYTLLESKDLV